MNLHQRILREAAERDPVDPMRRYVENGVKSLGCAYKFFSLKRKYPGDYERLVQEKRGQGKLFEGDGPHFKNDQQRTP